MQNAPWFGVRPRTWQESALPVVLDALRADPERRGVVQAFMGAGKSLLIRAVVGGLLDASGGATVVTTPRQFLVRQLWTTLSSGLGWETVGRFYADRKEAGRPVIVACNASAPALADDLRRRGRPVALWMADECHSAESTSLKTACDLLEPRRRLGFTATPYRSVERETLSLYNEVLFTYGYREAIRDGVLVPFDVHNWDGTGRRAREVDGICLDLIRAHARHLGPGIVNARDIEDCEAVACWLGMNGVRARPVHSGLPDGHCHMVLDVLARGDLDCAVHVNMLSEGVDYPWLRWICLRRKTGARVRFAQELGRVLRSHPGKSRAVVLDPYDLCREFDLCTAAAVGEALEREPVVGMEQPERGEPEVAPAVAVQVVEVWARRMLSHLRERGVAEGDPSWDPSWRGEKATSRQVAALGRLAWTAKMIPQPHRGAIKAICADGGIAPLLPRGAASDLLSSLIAVARASEEPRKLARETGQFWRYRWEWPSGSDWDAVAAPALGRLRVEAT